MFRLRYIFTIVESLKNYGENGKDNCIPIASGLRKNDKVGRLSKTLATLQDTSYKTLNQNNSEGIESIDPLIKKIKKLR